MRRRVAWITFWTTMAYWMGGVLGCANKVAPHPDREIALSYPRTPAAAAPSQPSLRADSLDRSHWEKVTIGPVDGRVLHHPLHYRDCAIKEPYTDANVAFGSHTVGDMSITTEQRIQDAMAEPDAGSYNRPNTLGLFVQPFKFAADTAMLPVNIVMNPPGSVHATGE